MAGTKENMNSEGVRFLEALITVLGWMAVVWLVVEVIMYLTK
jgi:hypothetical protein